MIQVYSSSHLGLNDMNFRSLFVSATIVRKGTREKAQWKNAGVWKITQKKDYPFCFTLLSNVENCRKSEFFSPSPKPKK